MLISEPRKLLGDINEDAVVNEIDDVLEELKLTGIDNDIPSFSTA